MAFGALKNIIRPLSRILISRSSTSTMSFLSSNSDPHFTLIGGGLLQSRQFTIFAEPSRFDSLTDRRFPKRRPLDKPRRKRSSLRPPGPFAWIKHEPGQPVPQSNPNQGSVKRRNEKKRMKLRRAFILAEAKKRKVQLQEAKRKKIDKRVERKMAAVAREREWAQRLVELQQLEEEKKKTVS